MAKFQARQGDVWIMSAPAKAKKGKDITDHGTFVAAYGEVTGHKHLVKGGKFNVFEYKETNADVALLDVEEKATMVHEEHSTIEIPPGKYIIRRQREWSDEDERLVAD